MKINLVLIVLFLIVSPLYSQVEFDFNLRIGKSLIKSEEFSRTINYTSRSQINDDQYIESKVEGINNFENIYSKGNILEAEANIIFPISHKLHFKTGIGLSYTEISFDLLLRDGEFNIISSDTIMGSFSTGVANPNFKPCEYENSFVDITVPNDRSSILSLLIPLELEYDLLDRFVLNAGGYLQTPIMTRHNSHNIQIITIEELEDVRLCRYTLRSDEESNGGRFNDAVLGLSIGGIYRLTPHISAEIKYRHSLSNTYADYDSNIFSFNRNTNEYRNRSVLLGLSYKFGHHDHLIETDEIK